MSRSAKKGPFVAEKLYRKVTALNERRALPLNQAVRIAVPRGVEDTLNYICGEHMVGGTIAAR